MEEQVNVNLELEVLVGKGQEAENRGPGQMDTEGKIKGDRHLNLCNNTGKTFRKNIFFTSNTPLKNLATYNTV